MSEAAPSDLAIRARGLTNRSMSDWRTFTTRSPRWSGKVTKRGEKIEEIELGEGADTEEIAAAPGAEIHRLGGER